MKKREKNKKMINVDEKSTENIKMKRIIKKEFLKKKENFDTMMFRIVDLKNSNARIFMKHHINDIMSISNNFTKFFFIFEKFFKERGRDANENKKKR